MSTILSTNENVYIYILYTCTSKLLHVPATKSLKRSKRRSKWKVDLFINRSKYKIIVHNVQSIIRTAQYLFSHFGRDNSGQNISFLIHTVKKDKNSQNIYQLISIWQSIKVARSGQCHYPTSNLAFKNYVQNHVTPIFIFLSFFIKYQKEIHIKQPFIRINVYYLKHVHVFLLILFEFLKDPIYNYIFLCFLLNVPFSYNIYIFFYIKRRRHNVEF